MKTSPHKLITCILPKGRARPVVRALKEKKGIIRTSVNNARGIGRFVYLHEHDIRQSTEKEILDVIASHEEAEDLFAFIYERAGINQPHGGMMYMCALAHATPFMLPDLPEEEQG